MHFDDTAWLDFVRGLLAPDEAWLMQQHLNVACGECSKAHAFWTRVNEFMAPEAPYETGAADIRMVTTAFANFEPESFVPGTLTVASLTYDSFRESAAAGFRSSLMQVRYLIYKADPWAVCLQINRELANEVHLTGQVTRMEADTGEAGRIALILQAADSPVASATTESSGEFHLQYRASRDLRLIAKVSPAEALEIRLPDPEVTNEETCFTE